MLRCAAPIAAPHRPRRRSSVLNIRSVWVRVPVGTENGSADGLRASLSARSTGLFSDSDTDGTTQKG